MEEVRELVSPFASNLLIREELLCFPLQTLAMKILPMHSLYQKVQEMPAEVPPIF